MGLAGADGGAEGGGARVAAQVGFGEEEEVDVAGGGEGGFGFEVGESEGERGLGGRLSNGEGEGVWR